MTAPFLEKIDWSRSWLAHVKTIGQAVAQTPDWRADINLRSQHMGLRNHRELPIRFIPQSELPPGVAYESHISLTGCVPTRDNLHDFFNALIWLTFPRIKSQLNALQAKELEKSEPSQGSSIRGKIRDAATIFDENAVLLVTANTELVEALRAHRWNDVFLSQRETFIGNCQIYLFGHALMEKLVQPYKSITGHMWAIHSPDLDASSIRTRNDLDDQVPRQLSSGLSTRDFSPLPVLGIPGWWEGQDELFYRDANVFRPKRISPNV